MGKRRRAISPADLSPGVRAELEAQGLAPEPTEEDEQRALIRWADETDMPGPSWCPEAGRWDPAAGRWEKIGDYLLAIPNGGGRSKAEGGALKAQGVRSGVPDLLLARPRDDLLFAGLWIELKRRKSGSVSENQRIWHVRLAAAGYSVCTARGWEDARDHILAYLEGDT